MGEGVRDRVFFRVMFVITIGEVFDFNGGSVGDGSC